MQKPIFRNIPDQLLDTHVCPICGSRPVIVASPYDGPLDTPDGHEELQFLITCPKCHHLEATAATVFKNGYRTELAAQVEAVDRWNSCCEDVLQRLFNNPRYKIKWRKSNSKK